ncbi:MAG TPA: SRPBCC family protein [Gaiellaceae bacterium]|nr:SRPBCC family protein [Gaiellaceae bacterium]
MATVTESITVNCPVSTTYAQWTRFEEFPDFMEGVRSVQQIDDAHLHWAAEIGGKRHEWDAEIIEQRPDQMIAWRALDGFYTSGRVLFEPLDGSTTKITVELEYEPEGMSEALGARLGEDNRQVAGDLDRFKELIESRRARDERAR